MKLTKITDQIICIEEEEYPEHSNCYLIIGSEKCLLVDTGIGLINFNAIKEIFVDKKDLLVLISHFHFDHIGGINQFKKVLGRKINFKEKDLGKKYFDLKNKTIEEFNVDESKVKTVSDEETINLGNLKFKIIFTPGHDNSSICLFEEKEKILISGDTIYDGNLYYYFKDSNKKEYIKSLEKILSLKPKIVLGGHNLPIKTNIQKFIKTKIQELT